MATSEELASAFARELAAGPVAPELGDALAARVREAREALPALAVDELALVAAIARSGVDVAACLPIDLALATLASRGDAAAIAELEHRYDAMIGFACRRFAGRDHSVDDLRQILRTSLFVGERPRIAEYSGRGSLANWLRITAVRTFIDLLRRKDRTREALTSDALPDAVSPADLALDAIKSEHRAIVAGALRDAVATLAAGTRYLLRQHLVLGVSIDQVGAALGLHRATAARRIAKAREELIATTRRLVAERLAISDRELDEVCGLVISGIDVSMRVLLATPVVEP